MNTKKALLLFILAALFLAACGSASPKTDSGSFKETVLARYPELKTQKMTTAKVKRVVDGDTFQLENGDKVRMIGCNTPETVKPDSPVEAYGKEASDYTKKRLTGATVYLFNDAGDTDKYGRQLRYVFIEGEPVMYNELLLREGYANVMTIQPNVMFSDRFVKAEREARSENKGLWSIKKSPSPAKTGDSHNEDSGKNQEDANQTAACAAPQIKGNINSKKEKIYHVPGSSSYEQTRAETMFCTENDAKKAGYRKAG
ncbi:thermonuclease family protein [Paenibacillus sp. UNC499MF]|uniref:thermonuclease family protein n=1 Tax=Paenibacillus sp. UNC499MF TaxID=1502751 RepID=UPI00089FC9D3|nr:thermonuclease family protein [Paenibacillus sp. UNC499MF]SEF54966.1 micrococcal nuclease [Paenibacillus sp. UNC499MF]